MAGDIIYNVIIDFGENKLNNLEVSGKIIDTNINILGKQKIENLNLIFNYNNQKLLLENLILKHKKILFRSNNILLKIEKNLINIKGDFDNKLNTSFLSNLTDYNINQYLDKNALLNSQSKFQVILNKKFKIKDYQIDSIIELANIKINLPDLNIKNYITNFSNKLIFKKGQVNLKISKKNNLKIKINSTYVLNEENQPKDFLLNYSKVKNREDYN